MRRFLPMVLLLAWASLPAAEPEAAEAAFLQALVARGEFDLALEYLRRVQPTAGADLRPYLRQLEPRLQAELDLAEGDFAGFEKRLSDVLPRLDELLVLPADAPFSMEARAARGEVLQRLGQEFLERALTETQPAERDRLARAAEEVLKKAEAAFADAVDKLEATKKAAAGNRLLAQRTAEAQAAAQYGRGLVLFDLSRLPGLNDQDSGRRLQQSILSLEKLAGSVSESAAWALRAQALMGHCYQGIDSRRAEEWFQKVLRERRPEANLAARDARFFKLQHLWQAVQGGRKAERSRFQADAESWLVQYGDWQRGPQGLQLRWQLATALLDEFAEAPENARAEPDWQRKLREASRHLQALAQLPCRFRPRAEEQLLAAQLLAGAPLRPVRELVSFAELVQRLKLTLLRLNQIGQQVAEAAATADRAPLLEQRQRLLAELAELTSKATAARPPDLEGKAALRWLQLRFDVLLKLERWAEAAAVGEEVLAQHAGSSAARQAAEQTLRLYLGLARRGEAGMADRLEKLARQVIAASPRSVAADLARELLGQRLYQERKYAEAAALFEQVSAESARHPWAQFQAGLAWWARCQQGLAATPPVDQPADRLRAFQLMEQALPRCEKDPSDEARRQAFNYRYLLADLWLRAGNVQKASETLLPLIERVEKGELPGGLPGDTAAQVLSLSLRAEVLRDPTSPAALARLNALQKLGAEGQLGGVAERLRELGQQLRDQMLLLEREGPAAAERLKITRERFLQFLGQLEKVPQPNAELTLWLAGQHLQLGNAEQAARLFARVPAPPADATPAQIQQHRAARLQGLAAQRQAAAGVGPIDRQARIAALETTLTELMAEEWAKRHPVCLKERILLMQLKQEYAQAAEQWERLRQALEPHAGKNIMFREVYDDARFNLVVCLAAQARQTEDMATKERLLSRAVQRIHLAAADAELKKRFDAWLGMPEQRELKALLERNGP